MDYTVMPGACGTRHMQNLDWLTNPAIIRLIAGLWGGWLPEILRDHVEFTHDHDHERQCRLPITEPAQQAGDLQSLPARGACDADSAAILVKSTTAQRVPELPVGDRSGHVCMQEWASTQTRDGSETATLVLPPGARAIDRCHNTRIRSAAYPEWQNSISIIPR